MMPYSKGLFNSACLENVSTVYNPAWLGQAGSNFELFPFLSLDTKEIIVIFFSSAFNGYSHLISDLLW